MLKKIKLYYFGPTGGTEKVGKAFAKAIERNIQAPRNHPYKPEMTVPAVPICLASCTLYGKCEPICPVSAILPQPLQEKMDEMLGVLKSVRNGNEVFL